MGGLKYSDYNWGEGVQIKLHVDDEGLQFVVIPHFFSLPLL